MNRIIFSGSCRRTCASLRNTANWTEQVERAQLLEACGKSWGVYNKYGKYYGLLIIKARVDETVLSALLSVGIEGNFRTLTLKAFTEFEGIKKIEQLSWACFVVSILKRKILIIILCL